MSFMYRAPFLLLFLIIVLSAVGCDTGTAPVRGVVRVTISTSGNARDADGWTIFLDSTRYSVRGDTTLVLRQVRDGVHTVTLGGVDQHCTLASPERQAISVANGGTAQLTFALRCLGRFAYLGGGILHYVDETGADHALAPSVSPSGVFRWSPDGTRIAVAAGPHGASHIYVVRADGSGFTQLTNGPGGEAMPTWSPEGDRIAYVSPELTSPGQNALYVMNADGSNARQVAPPDTWYERPTWMRDGRRLVVHYGSGLFYVDAQTGERQAAAAAAGGGWNPAVSPDGANVAFELMVAGVQTILVLPDGRSAARPVSTGARAHCLLATWAPDGRSLLHMCVLGSNFQLFRSNADGSGTVNLSGLDTSDEFPSVSPDGRWILVQSLRMGNVFRPYAMNADGSLMAPVVAAEGYLPTWRP